jgi:hypothetical protein
MNLKKIVDTLILSLIGFTIIHGLLTFVIFLNRNLYEQIAFHYSNDLTWYIMFYGLPLLIGVLFALIVRNRAINKALKVFLYFIALSQIGFTITAVIHNHNYWGYFIKRPPIFKEILQADKVITCGSISNTNSTEVSFSVVISDTTSTLDNLRGRKDPYYGLIDRPFMVFEDNAHINGHLYDFPKIYQDKTQKPMEAVLKNINNEIQQANYMFQGNNNWVLNGITTEFITTDSIKYLIAGLSGAEIQNDHYPFYEFLFVNENNNYKLIKKQKFFTDFAGEEGFEYVNIATLFSLLLTVVGLLGGLIIWLIRLFVKRIKNKQNNRIQ